jgi:hypothetical protein
MRRFQSMFVRERGRLFRRRCNVMQRSQAACLSADILNGLAGDWAPWLAAPDDDLDLYREEIAGRLRREAGLEPTGGADWKDLLEQREREIAAFRRIGLRPQHLMAPVRVPALREGEVIHAVPAGRAATPFKFFGFCMRFMQKIFATCRQV